MGITCHLACTKADGRREDEGIFEGIIMETAISYVRDGDNDFFKIDIRGQLLTKTSLEAKTGQTIKVLFPKWPVQNPVVGPDTQPLP